jgi:hypothetical protein
VNPDKIPQSRRHVLGTVCQAVLWFLIVIKALWLAMAVSDLHFVSPLPLFTIAFIVLLAATLLFQTPKLVIALILSWIGVILGYVAGHVSGVVPGYMVDRMHEQFLYHWADITFLVFAHLVFFLRCVPRPTPPADAR